MTIVNYKKVKCPRCGKSYFKVKENNDFITLGFKFRPAPIYKDGELQNPVEVEPNKERCRCLECGCNFRVEFIDFSGEYKFVDEDEESEEHLKKIKECMKVHKPEQNHIRSLENTDSPLQVIGDSTEVGICLSKTTVKYGGLTVTGEDLLRDELDKLKERLEKLEKKESL